MQNIDADPIAGDQGDSGAQLQPPTRGARGRRRGGVIAVSTALAVAVVTGSAFGLAATGVTSGAAAAAPSVSSSAQISTAMGRSGYGYGYGYGYGNGAGDGSAGSQSTAGTTSTLASATAAQEVGVVDITSELTYAQAESAGTGIVLTASGEILTNNHVVEGATSISVTVVSTGAVYTATVVGTDATHDVAVLQLSGASGLTTASIDAAADTAVGEAVTGVGNAGGVGGTPSASPGTVTALEQTITTQAEQTAASETLDGLIETDADIQAGDSGGPLFNAADQVIGIDTAAAQGGATVAGYAIPIEDALSIAAEIESGQASSTVTIGNPAFLGVEIGSTDATGSTVEGAAIAGVIDGGPAATAGLAAGDTIVALNGTPIASAETLTQALSAFAPGQAVSVSWMDSTGASHTAELTLGTGPAA
ncbi:S1C family serine protease [Leifsonia sp. 2TAF2]|uniref:S1C family serine protease n=1 Tax=Leifsonia sp. 2TAF2 TaxID=3233009 RepID=UPI003F9B707E